ncbi:MAG TPA: TetR/AcrR family transcriptional regulator [Blastocatellia bacterium]
MQRTRQALAEALLSLTIEKGYENVTVQQVLDRTGIGRSTFYAHFRDKDDLLLSNLANLRKGLFSHWESMITSKATSRGEFGFLLPFLKHLDDARHLHRALTRGESGPITERQLHRILADLIRADIAEYANGRWDGPALDAAVQLIAGGMMSLLGWWLDNKIDLSPEELDRLFRDIALNGLRSHSGGPGLGRRE